jgi:hypothetical protein
MRPTRVESAQSRRTIIVCCALIAAELLLLVPVFLRWAHGVPPVHPGYYASRLLSAITLVAIMGALLVTLSHLYHTFRGRVVSWLLLGISAFALAAQVIIY